MDNSEKVATKTKPKHSAICIGHHYAYTNNINNSVFIAVPVNNGFYSFTYLAIFFCH